MKIRSLSQNLLFIVQRNNWRLQVLRHFRDQDPSTSAQIVAVAFEEAAFSALPRHLSLPGTVVIEHSVDSLRSQIWAANDMPGIVISPLVAGHFDAQDVAGILAAKGFHGRYIAVANNVAAPDVIRDDVARVAPALHFDVVTLDVPPKLRVV